MRPAIYAVDGLYSGSYKVSFRPCGRYPEDRNILSEYYGGVDNFEDATAITVTEGTITAGISTQLDVGGILEGNVADAAGDPSAERPASASSTPKPTRWCPTLTARR